VPLCDWIDYLKSSLPNSSSVPTVNCTETGGRTVDAVGLLVELNTSHCGIAKLYWDWKQMAERCVTLGCVMSKGVCVLNVLWSLYVLTVLRQ
jgi:hypothetical protein